MTKSTKRFFLLLPAIIIIANEVIRTYIRPIYGKQEFGIISEILGWLPNFLASLGFITIGISLAILIQDISNKPLTKKQSILVLSIFIVIGLLGFIGHEINQKETELFYDLNDIYATVIGVLAGSLLFYFTIIKNKI